MEVDPLELARTIPDLPRWVWARGMLLSGRCTVIGPPEGCVVRHLVKPFASVLGEPTAGILRAAVGGEEGYLEMSLQGEHVDRVGSALPGWRILRSVIHSPGPRSRAVEEIDANGVRLLRPQDGPLLDRLSPTAWRVTLLDALESSRVAARFVDGEPVSFCAACAVTETLWDLGVITVPGRRGRGHAEACCAFLIREMRRGGKEPVWGATETNAPSLRLAERLGFIASGEIFDAVRPEFVGGPTDADR